jgi:hypothetical protein
VKDEAYVPSTPVGLKSLRIEYERRSQELIVPNGEMLGTQFNLLEPELFFLILAQLYIKCE